MTSGSIGSEEDEDAAGPIRHDSSSAPNGKEDMRALKEKSPHAAQESGIKEIHNHIRGRGLISSIALGISDGLVTNVAFLAGFSGAVNSIGLIRLAGIAAMLAGGVSMFFGALLAARSEIDLFHADSRREASEIEHEPEEERQELKNFYLQKGLTHEEAEMVVDRVTSSKKKWLEDILIHELHLHEAELENPFAVAASTGLAFILGAAVPLLAYLLLDATNFAILASMGASFLFLFVVGAWKGRLVGKSIWRSGLEMLLVGAVASILLYFIGRLLVFV